MDGKVVAALICYLFAVSCAAQDDYDELFNFSRRKSTTKDPISDFFSNPKKCSSGSGVCIKECSDISLMRPDVECGTFLVCCTKESDNGFVFPTRPVTRPPTTTTERIRKTRPTTTTSTTRTTTTTTTTEEPELPEEPFDPEDCGYGSSEKDSRGQAITDSHRGEFPWNVGIFTREKFFGFDQNIFHCGGSIIDDFVIITAASCVYTKDKSTLIVIAGIQDVASTKEKRQERTVDQIIVHPNFQHSSRIYDIAFLYLSDKYDYSRTINRICLPKLGINLKESNCLVTGWGDGTTKGIRPAMKTVEVQLMESKSCEDNLRRMMYRNIFKLSETFQCVEEEPSTVNIGTMDLGSPLVCTIPGKDRQFYQVGIFSWNKLEPNLPSVFTNVTMFREWIDEKMKLVDRLTYIYEPQIETDDE